MKTLKTKTIFLIAALSAMGLVGCGPGNPVPVDAVKSCLDAGGTPDYFSNSMKTQFECIKTAD